MSLSTAEHRVRGVPGGRKKIMTPRVSRCCHRLPAMAFGATVALCVALTAGRIAADEFKTLLAAAGTLVFGEPTPPPAASQPASAPNPPGPVQPAPPILPAPQPAPATPPVRTAAPTPPPAMDPGGRPTTAAGTPSPTTANAAQADSVRVDAARTGRDAEALLQKLLPPRSDNVSDWYASVECLHAAGEPRSLPPCVPPPPCDPSQPPQPYDLIGFAGVPSGGPIYRGPCEPRSARKHHWFFGWCHQVSDHLFDHFYRSK